MKEADYIVAGDLARVYCVQALLRTLVADIGNGITAKELMRVNRLVSLWQQRLNIAAGGGDAKDRRYLAECEAAWKSEKGES